MAATSTSRVKLNVIPPISKTKQADPPAPGSDPKVQLAEEELPPEAEMAGQPLLGYGVTGEDGSELKTAKRTAEGELLDKLTTAGGKAMDIETSTLRAKAIQTYEVGRTELSPSPPPMRKEEEQGKEPLTGVRRFRKLARMVKTNLAWSRDMHDKHEEDSNTFTVNSEDQNLTFNVDNFKLTKKMYGGLSPRVRNILGKHPSERSQSDIRVLQDIVSRLQCFNKYSAAARKELARIIFFESVDDGRVVIQQGHIGVSFYFIISGTVNVKFTEVDKVTGEKRILHLGQLNEGSSFGELALLHNIRRTATIVCKGDCQFLRVDKSDFEEVLGAVSNREYQRRYDFLVRLASFRDWKPRELATCNAHCRIVDYPANKLIQGPNDNKLDDFVCYIVSGECSLVRELLLVREMLPFGGKKLHLPTEDQLKHYHDYLASKKEGWREHLFVCGLERHLWTICSFKRDNYFGVGENIKDTYFVSKTKMEVLLVPKVYFLKVGRSKTIDMMRENLNKYLPTNRTLYNNYFADQKWRKYKDNEVREILSRRHVKTNTSVLDVPMSIRISNQCVDVV